MTEDKDEKAAMYFIGFLMWLCLLGVLLPIVIISARYCWHYALGDIP